MRYFIYLSYDGARYHGWQIQPNANSVQAELTRAVSIINGCNTEVVGAGRTDTGVNARMMVAHFDSDLILDIETAIRINRILPQDIAVQKICRVSDEAHARFSATSRTYQYFIHTDRDPFNRNYSFHITFPISIEKMNEAASRLFNYTDFTSFSKLHTDTKTNNCTIMQAHWDIYRGSRVQEFNHSELSEPSEFSEFSEFSKLSELSELSKLSKLSKPFDSEGTPNQMVFTIQADRFLRNMVRAIVGTLIDVGRGQITVDEFCKIIEKKDRCSAGMSVPGNALFLTDIQYPPHITTFQTKLTE